MKEYIFQFDEGLYDEATVEMVFNPTLKGELIRCKDCMWLRTRIPYQWQGQLIQGASSCNLLHFNVDNEDFYCANGRKKEEQVN